MTNNQIKFGRNVDIGSLEAEDDKLLLNAFVEKDDFKFLKDLDNQKCIVVGRTGTGKSALIRVLKETEEHVARIKPEEMSLRYLSNSDILEYFRRLDIKLDLFYKVLWKHVFIVEILKLYYGENKLVVENKILSVFENINFVFNKKKKKAIEYLRKWHDKFWEKTEYRIKELEENLKNSFKDSLGVNANLFEEFVKASASSDVEQIIEKSKKFEVIHKAQSVVNDIQLEEISTILDIIKNDLLPNSKKKYFIVIDDLDKEWVDNKILFDLIVALIHTIKEINQCLNIKIVVALRLNLYQLSLQKASLRGTQREKFANMILHLYWTKEELFDLLQRRVNVLAKKEHVQHIDLNEILPKGDARGNKLSGFEYIINRTLYRPRDVISFFNKIIKNNGGKTRINREAFRWAESEYSLERLQAIEDEWRENVGKVKVYTDVVMHRPFKFKAEDINERDVKDFCYKIFKGDCDKDTRQIVSNGWKESKVNSTKEFILNKLYQFGIIGIKTSPHERIYYSFLHDNSLEEFQLKDDYVFYVNPAFFNSLQIKQNIDQGTYSK